MIKNYVFRSFNKISSKKYFPITFWRIFPMIATKCRYFELLTFIFQTFSKNGKFSRKTCEMSLTD